MYPTDTTRPPMKRRRLVKPCPSPSVPPTTFGENPVTAKATALSASQKGVCASCHRGVHTTAAGSSIQCSVCTSTTCTVCSRTCTHSAASRPPTPFLTLSPTPSPSPTPSLRRFALTLSMNVPSATDASAAHSIPSPKRKKVSDDDAADEGDAIKDQGFYGPGCGQRVCRKCCWEDIRNNTITCFQCYGLSS